MELQFSERRKLDESDDALFYALPRFVTHVDEGFIQQLTTLYRERLTPHSRILDLMSSWISHLPPEMDFAHVEGHGLNAAELAENSRLNHYFVQDLNQNPLLPLADAAFEAILIAVSIQYLQQPEPVFAELSRILKPGGILIVSFSNRMFYQKAIQVWRDGSDASRLQLVQRYIRATAGFTEPEVIRSATPIPVWLQRLGLGSQDPFYAVVAYRQERTG